uniref:Uncharacterized protein n=1 Tax=Salix viminalis TaxID=40686 RepID=A0A6N2NLV4_SALVM
MAMALALAPSFFKLHCSSSPTNPTSTIRPAVILPGLGNNTGDYQKLELTLQEYGVPTVVAKVSRFDWLRNAAGLVDPNYWSGSLRPRPVLDWYLKRIDEAVQEAKEQAQGQTLSLIGHSAGGWLARVYMEEFGQLDVSLPPPKGVPGVIDQTRGLLYYVEKHCKKAVYTPELRYGLGNNTGDYQKLELTLQEYGVPTVVAKVSRFDWLRNAAGLVDPNYWSGSLRPRPVLDWYLKRIDEAVQEAKEQAQGQTLSLIGHSAGGWLARVYMEEFGQLDVSLLLTLGHLQKACQGDDQTRGLLYYVEKHCKKLYTPELRYVCIAGRYIQGARFVGDSNVEAKSMRLSLLNDLGISTSTSPGFRARFVGQGYKQVCGQADVWGDGVVPEVSAHLDGAFNISLDGVYHSPVGSEDELRPWYGSPAVVEQWIHHLLD